MAKTLDVSLRNQMLEQIPANANYIELVHGTFDGENTDEGSFSARPIAWLSASNGSLVQDGTISFDYSYTSQDLGTTITGYRLYTGRQIIQGESTAYEGTSQVAEGEFASPVTIQLDGTTYTINISGVTISMPASGS